MVPAALCINISSKIMYEMKTPWGQIWQIFGSWSTTPLTEFSFMCRSATSTATSGFYLISEAVKSTSTLDNFSLWPPGNFFGLHSSHVIGRRHFPTTHVQFEIGLVHHAGRFELFQAWTSVGPQYSTGQCVLQPPMLLYAHHRRHRHKGFFALCRQ